MMTTEMNKIKHFMRHNGTPKIYNFNCWNTTMRYFGYPFIEWTTEEEIESFLKKRFRCVKTTTNLKEPVLQIGDVVAFYENKQIIHTSVYVGRKLFLHKPGTNNVERCFFKSLLYWYEETNTMKIWRKHEILSKTRCI